MSDPYAPRLLPPINVPGVVIHFDSATGVIVTRDLQEREERTSSADDCYARGIASEDGQTCRVFPIQLNTLTLDGERAVRTSRLELDHGRLTPSMAVSDSRVFYLTVERERALSDPRTYPDDFYEVTPLWLESIAIDSGLLVPLPAQELRRVNRNSFSYTGELYARDQRAFEFFGPEVTVIDTAAPDAPTRLTRQASGLGCQSLEISGDTAYCAAGEAGVEVLDLSSVR